MATNTCNCEVGYQGDFCEALTESKGTVCANIAICSTLMA